MARDDLADIAVPCNALILPVDCREGMRLCLAPASVHTVVTSPPYYDLRDYEHADQIGLEQTPEEYVASMVAVFREIWRVLRDDGTVWLVIGDSYARNPPSRGSGPNGKHDNIPDYGRARSVIAQNAKLGSGDGFVKRGARAGTRARVDGVKEKDLIGIPWRVAFALQADGWFLRQEIIWAKPNAMPESVKDRCTKAHETIFLLSKSPTYYFNADAIAEAASYPQGAGNKPDSGRYAIAAQTDPHMRTKGGLAAIGARKTRNKRSVWAVTTKPYRGAHFATFPPDLIAPCILAGSPGGGTVLDPFGGAGTTALVAQRLGRNSVSFELNPKYVAMAEARLAIG